MSYLLLGNFVASQRLRTEATQVIVATDYIDVNTTAC
jgi:hypothetical protein